MILKNKSYSTNIYKHNQITKTVRITQCETFEQDVLVKHSCRTTWSVKRQLCKLDSIYSGSKKSHKHQYIGKKIHYT